MVILGKRLLVQQHTHNIFTFLQRPHKNKKREKKRKERERERG